MLQKKTLLIFCIKIKIVVKLIIIGFGIRVLLSHTYLLDWCVPKLMLSSNRTCDTWKNCYSVIVQWSNGRPLSPGFDNVMNLVAFALVVTRFITRHRRCVKVFLTGNTDVPVRQLRGWLLPRLNYKLNIELSSISYLEITKHTSLWYQFKIFHSLQNSFILEFSQKSVIFCYCNVIYNVICYLSKVLFKSEVY